MIDVETIGSRSNITEIDIDIQRRPRASRTMTSMPVVANTNTTKCKGIDIRDAEPSMPKKDFCDGGNKVFNRINESNKVNFIKGIPTFFYVDFTKYSVGASDSAHKQ